MRRNVTKEPEAKQTVLTFREVSFAELDICDGEKWAP